MLTHVEARGFANEAEPVGLLTEGAAGIAVIVLAIIALAGVSPEALTSIAAIVIGVGLMVQAFNSAAEHSKMVTANAGTSTHAVEFGGDVMVDCMCGLTGIVLGILALVGMNAAHLLPPALIVFGGALLVSGAMAVRPRTLSVSGPGSEAAVVRYQGFAGSRRNGNPDRAGGGCVGHPVPADDRGLGFGAGRIHRSGGRNATRQRDVQRRCDAPVHRRLIEGASGRSLGNTEALQ